MFGFDPTVLSDEELLHKKTDFVSKLVWLDRVGQGDTMKMQIQSYIQAIEREQYDRYMITLAKRNTNPVIIDTDLTDTTPVPAQKEKKPARNQGGLVKTTKPTKD